MERTKGYLFAFLSTLAMSNVYIFSKSALHEISLAQFGFYWFGFALFLFVLLTLFRRKNEFSGLGAKCYKTLLIVGLLEIVSTSMFFLSIKTIDNPTIVSFLGNLKPIFVLFLGFIILGEKFNRPESFGVAISIIGAIILGYQDDFSFQALYDNGVIFILGSIFFGALSMILVRKNSVKIPSVAYAISRSLFLMLASSIYLFKSNDSLLIPVTAIKYVVLGATLGPFLAILSFYHAIKFLEASRVSLVGTSKGIFVLIGSFVMFEQIPENHQLIGGLLTIFGVIVMILSKRRSK